MLWVGGLGGIEVELVKRVGIPFEGIPAAGLHGVGALATLRNFIVMVTGTVAAIRILHRFCPDVLLFTGGYIAVPVAMGTRLSFSRLRRPRSLLFVPDIEPGLAIKFVSRFATHVAVVNEEARGYFSPKLGMSVTGYPIRQELRQWKREEARQTLGLSSELPILLVFGGSKGARSINRALMAVLPRLLDEMQVIHVSGTRDWQEVHTAQDRLDEGRRARYHAFPYLHEEMGAAMAAADLVLSRAGAATLGEYPYFGLPAILVPYPFAWQYQYRNARFLERHGAAVILKDQELGEKLEASVKELIKDRVRLEKMGQAMRSLAYPQAADRLADLLTALADRNMAKGS